MFKILKTKQLAPQIKLLEISAPLIAEKFQAGQFVILRLEEGGERIPLTISDANKSKGTITIVAQGIGRTTNKLNQKSEGETILDLVGPLGKASEIKKVGTVVVIGGGVGTAIAYPTAKAFKKAGNRVISIIGGRNRELIILEDELKQTSDELIITTDDGSKGLKGFVTDALKKVITETQIDEVLAIGPIPMMESIAELTRSKNIKTIVSLNPIMVDGTGMCGGCRVTVNKKTLFACVDGPEFDAHQVDFTTLKARNKTYHSQEKLKESENVTHSHKILSANCNLAKLIEKPEPNTLSAKERLAIPRCHMPEQSAETRKNNFEEVNLGLTLNEAMREAKRCLNCKSQPCVSACPVNIKIPVFLQHLAEGNLEESYMVLRHDNCLPSITGRVCPQEHQCEGKCVRAKNPKDGAVGIGNLERFVADWGRVHLKNHKSPTPSTGKKIAIIGSGPAGLATAGDLIQYGYDVEVFEALHEMGGVLTYGIPEFRLPKQIVKQQISELKDEGVKFTPNVVIGKTLLIDDLLKNYNAVFVGSGAGLPVFLNIPGEDYNGVYSANEFLTRANLMKAYDPAHNETPIYSCKDKIVAVFGGGNTAMDSIRTAIRLGAKKAYLVYRRTENEMPARLEEIRHAKEEGAEILELSAPLEFLSNNTHELKSVKLQKMKLGEADPSGRKRPEAIEGSEYELEIHMAIIAIGNNSNPLISYTTPEISVNKHGNIVISEETTMTSKKGVFAGGDIVSGGATVILAMGAGRKSAKNLHEYLSRNT